jgi:hypothetical protein
MTKTITKLWYAAITYGGGPSPLRYGNTLAADLATREEAMRVAREYRRAHPNAQVEVSWKAGPPT